MMIWRSYHGSHEPAEWDQQPATRFTPQWSGHSRHTSRTVFIPPVVVAGWMRVEDADPQNPWDGISLHLGHIGNDRNYIINLVRPDNHMVISREYGWRHYDDLDGSRRTDGLDLTVGGVYVYRVEWHPTSIVATVANEIATVTIAANIGTTSEQGRSEGSHVPIIPCGAVGWRLDHLTAAGQTVVRELAAGSGS